MSSLRHIVTAVLLAFPLVTYANAPVSPSAFVTPNATPKQSVVSAFTQYLSVSPTISVPTVLEIPLTLDANALPVLAVFNLTTNEFEPYVLKESVTRLETASTIGASGATGNTYAISDGNYETYLEFPVREGANRADITFTFNKPIVASSVSFVLDANVALPQTISLQAARVDGPYTVLASTRLSRTSVAFPKTTSSVWHISFEYVQPLRIAEMKFNESSSPTLVSKSARFLAQPGQSYQIYVNADRYVQSVHKEAGDLLSNRGVITYDGSSLSMNSSYTPADSDGDSIPDLTDNCVGFTNADQKDTDSNGRGDMCEDYDRDGVINGKDNCPESPNQAQTDTDVDDVGDICDTLDNRVTERLPWLPWAGVGIAGVVLLGLFVLAFKYKREEALEMPNFPGNQPMQ